MKIKKVILFLGCCLLSTNCTYAKGFNLNFLDKLKDKPLAQERLAPVKKVYDGELTLSEQAVILYNENNLNAALKKLVAIKENQKTAEDWLLIGNILQDQEKDSDAVFMYQRSINTDPKFYKAYYNLGNMYLEDEKPYLAIENYKKAKRYNRDFPYVYYNLGCAYLKIGQLRKAKTYFIRAIDIKNTEPDFHYNLAYTYKKMKKEKLARLYLGYYNKLMGYSE